MGVAGGAAVKLAWRELIVHHSAGPDGITLDADGIRRYHVDVKGFIDIGYHHVIEREGDRYIHVPGRPETMQGAHSPGHNQTALGVCLVGDFTDSPPPLPQLHVTAQLCADLCRKYDIRAMDIRPHRAFRKTECPGKSFTDHHMMVLRAEVARILRHTAPGGVN